MTSLFFTSKSVKYILCFLNQTHLFKILLEVNELLSAIWDFAHTIWHFVILPTDPEEEKIISRWKYLSATSLVFIEILRNKKELCTIIFWAYPLFSCRFSSISNCTSRSRSFCARVHKSALRLLQSRQNMLRGTVIRRRAISSFKSW